jgi:hypothetical protein
VEGDAPFDAILSLNMVHVAPWQAALGLLADGKRLLRPDYEDLRKVDETFHLITSRRTWAVLPIPIAPAAPLLRSIA